MGEGGQRCRRLCMRVCLVYLECDTSHLRCLGTESSSDRRRRGEEHELSTMARTRNREQKVQPTRPKTSHEVRPMPGAVRERMHHQRREYSMVVGVSRS